MASSRLMKARQYVTAETLMMEFVPARRLQNFVGGHATWSCRCICDILVWQNHHVKGILCHVKWPWSIVNAIQAWPTTETYDMSGKHWLNTISLLSGGAVRRNSLRCAPFGPPTVSYVLAPQTIRKVLARLKYSVPLYKSRSGFSILTEECLTFRTTSRENLSPAGTAHFPRPWVGHVRRTASPDERHGDEDIQPWKTV